MAIMNARDAYIQAKHATEIKEIEATIEKYINDAVLKGELSVHVPFNRETCDEVRLKIAKDLNDLGYEVRIPNYEKENTSDPDDSWRTSDTMKITWWCEKVNKI